MNENRLPQPLLKTNLVTAIIFFSSLFFSHAQFFTIATPFYLPFLAFLLMYFPKYRMSSIMGALLGALLLNVGQFLILCIQLVLLFSCITFHRQKDLLLLYVNISFITGQCIWQFIYYGGIPPQSVIVAVAIEWLLVLICSILFIRVFMLWPFSFKDKLSEEKIAFYALYFAIIIVGMSSLQFGAFHFAIFTMHLLLCIVAYQFSTSRALLFATVIGLFTAVSEFHFSAMTTVVMTTAVTVIFLRQLPKIIVALGSVVPSILFFLYDTTLPLDIVYFTSIVIAAAVFYGIPSFPKEREEVQQEVLSKSTVEEPHDTVSLEQVRGLLQLSYEMLSTTQNTEQFVRVRTNDSPPSLCQQCIRYSYCFEKNENNMQSVIDRWLQAKRHQKLMDRLKYEQVIAKKCIKPNVLLEELSVTTLEERLHIQALHGKQMLSLQMQDFLKHLEQEVYMLEHGNDKNHFHMMDQEEDQTRFQYEYQIFSKSKNRKDVSGDAFHVFQLNERYVCILLSDGMGHAEKANNVSKRIIHYMQRLLKQSIEPATAMHTIHYLFSMQFGQETFATLDVSLIDLHDGKYYCWKAGCMSTFIARGGDVFNVNSFSPPIGAIPQLYIEMCSQDLKSNDMIWIVSDGLFSIQESVSQQEQVFKNIAARLSQRDLSIHASLYELMDLYEMQYPLMDDCTVIAIRLQHQVAPWQLVEQMNNQ